MVLNVYRLDSHRTSRSLQKGDKMTVRNYLETYGIHDNAEISVVGLYEYGLVDLYKGSVKKLLQIYQVADILEKKNWGGLDKNKCFLTMNVNRHSGDNLFVDMPNGYKHKDKNGNRLDCYI